MRLASLGLVAASLAAPAAAAPLALGFEALESEAEIGLDVSGASDRLAGLIADLHGRLDVADGPHATLSTIAEALREVCPVFVADAQGGLYGPALASGACDCDVLTVTYLTVGEAAGLPLRAVFLPGHVLVRWDAPEAPVYWETTTAQERPAWYLEALVPEGAERAYLQPQTREQMQAHLYQVRASYRHATGDASGALADWATAAHLNPTYLLTYLNRGRAHLLGGAPEAAAADFTRALRLDPTQADGLYGRATAHLALGRPEKAVPDLLALLERSGPAADALHALGVAYGAMGRDADALQAFANALAADPSFAYVYEARGDLYARAGHAAEAQRDYETYLRLAPASDAAPVRTKLRALEGS